MRRLPLIPTTRTSRGPDELELGRQLDLPADGVAAVREGQLPVQAPVATVDRRAQLERGPLVAERVPGRRPIATRGCDGRLIPRTTSSPVTIALPSSRSSISVERKHERRVRVRLEEVVAANDVSRNSVDR